MVKITLKKKELNNSTTNLLEFPIDTNREKRECAKKIIDFIIQGYVCPTPVGEYGRSNSSTNLDNATFRDLVEMWIQYPDIVDKIENVNEGHLQTCINKISERLRLINQDTIITFVRSPRNNNNNNNNTEVITGGMKKEYVKLQKGGKRLIRYGKRGGKYYMKGGRKVYIK